jgi:hypothetical protein
VSKEWYFVFYIGQTSFYQLLITDYLCVCFHIPCADAEGAGVNNAASAYKERMNVKIDYAFFYNS